MSIYKNVRITTRQDIMSAQMRYQDGQTEISQEIHAKKKEFRCSYNTLFNGILFFSYLTIDLIAHQLYYWTNSPQPNYKSKHHCVFLSNTYSARPYILTYYQNYKTRSYKTNVNTKSYNDSNYFYSAYITSSALLRQTFHLDCFLGLQNHFSLVYVSIDLQDSGIYNSCSYNDNLYIERFFKVVSD